MELKNIIPKISHHQIKLSKKGNNKLNSITDKFHEQYADKINKYRENHHNSIWKDKRLSSNNMKYSPGKIEQPSGLPGSRSSICSRDTYITQEEIRKVLAAECE